MKMLHEILLLGTSFPVLAVEFAVAAGLVLVFARKLSIYCDALEKTTSISAVFIGAIFLAIVTSMPEAVATIGSAIMEGAVNLGAGNLFGSNTFNLLIVVLLDLLHRGSDLFVDLRSNISLVALSGVAMMLLVGGSILLNHGLGVSLGQPWVGLLCSILIFAGYLRLSRISTRELPDEVLPKDVINPYTYSRARIVSRLVVYSLLLIGVSSYLLRVCDVISVTPFVLGGNEVVLGRTLTGTFLLSMATSLPEISVAVSAMRLGQINMAVGNVLGSNMVNMSFIPIMHLFTLRGGFYSELDLKHLVILGVSVLMSLIFMLGLRVKAKREFMRLGWESWAMLAVYLAGAFLVLRAGLQV